MISFPLALHGLVFGWLTALFLCRMGIYAPVENIPLHPLNFCEYKAYPKRQDYIWYGVLLLSGILGILAANLLRKMARKRDVGTPSPHLPLLLGIPSGLMALLLLLRESSATAPGAFIFLAVFGYSLMKHAGLPEILPVANEQDFPGHSRSRNNILVLVLSAVISLAWFYDPYLQKRYLDMLHEGVHLLYFQSALAGDMPGLDIYTEYSPLYTYSIIWFLKAAGVTVEALRWYFVAVQILGTAIVVYLLIRLSGSLPVTLVAISLFLLQSTASPAFDYGWANTLRISLPMLGIYLSWKSLCNGKTRFAAAAGILSGISIAYSQEFGLASVISSAFLFGVSLFRSNGRPSVKVPAIWAAGVSITFISVMMVIFGCRMPDALWKMAGESYILTRLTGNVARPIPSFLGWTTESLSYYGKSPVSCMGWSYFIWMPGIVVGIAIARFASLGTGRGRDILLTFIPFTLACQLPSIARPLGVPASTLPPIVLLGILVCRSGNPVSRSSRFIDAYPVILLFLAAIFFGPNWKPAPIPRLFMRPERAVAREPRLERLGDVWINEKQRKYLVQAVDTIRRNTRAGEHIFISDSFHQIVAFLADRPGLPPFPEPTIAGSQFRRTLIMSELRRHPPRLAIISTAGLDVPYPFQFPEQYAFITRNYSLLKEIDYSLFYLRR